MTGHIRRRGTHSWELKFESDNGTGVRKTRYVSFKGTKRAAAKELERLVSLAASGEFVPPVRQTVAEFLDTWERDFAVPNTTPKTLERYRELLRLHIRPHVGTTRLQALSTSHLQALYAKLLREGRGAGVGLSARTVKHVHRVIHRALGHAVAWKLIGTNPAAAAEPPKVEETEVEILKEPQVRAVLKGFRGSALHPIVALALATGMRRGELCALRWQDIDSDGKNLRVVQSVEVTNEGGLRIKAPKTKYGRRTISVNSAMAAHLRSHWAAVQERRLALGLGKSAPEDRVFAPAWGNEVRNPDGLTKEVAKAMAALKMPGVHLHMMRHTHASQLIADGMDVLTISRRLGHGSPAITLRVYGHLFKNTDARAAEVMEKTFRAAETD